MQAQEPIRGFDRQANNSKELDYWDQQEHVLDPHPYPPVCLTGNRYFSVSGLERQVCVNAKKKKKLVFYTI